MVSHNKNKNTRTTFKTAIPFIKLLIKNKFNRNDEKLTKYMITDT